MAIALPQCATIVMVFVIVMAMALQGGLAMTMIATTSKTTTMAGNVAGVTVGERGGCTGACSGGHIRNQFREHLSLLTPPPLTATTVDCHHCWLPPHQLLMPLTVADTINCCHRHTSLPPRAVVIYIAVLPLLSAFIITTCHQDCVKS